MRELFRNLITAQETRAARDREELLSMFPRRGTINKFLQRGSEDTAERSEVRERDAAGEVLDAWSTPVS